MCGFILLTLTQFSLIFFYLFNNWIIYKNNNFFKTLYLKIGNDNCPEGLVLAFHSLNMCKFRDADLNQITSLNSWDDSYYAIMLDNYFSALICHSLMTRWIIKPIDLGPPGISRVLPGPSASQCILQMTYSCFGTGN